MLFLYQDLVIVFLFLEKLSLFLLIRINRKGNKINERNTAMKMGFVGSTHMKKAFKIKENENKEKMKMKDR